MNKILSAVALLIALTTMFAPNRSQASEGELVYENMSINRAISVDCMYTALPMTCAMVGKLDDLDKALEKRNAVTEAVTEATVLGFVHRVDVNDAIGTYLISYFVDGVKSGDDDKNDMLLRYFRENGVAKMTCSFSIAENPVTLFDIDGEKIDIEDTSAYFKNTLRLICEVKATAIMEDARLFHAITVKIQHGS